MKARAVVLARAFTCDDVPQSALRGTGLRSRHLSQAKGIIEETVAELDAQLQAGRGDSPKAVLLGRIPWDLARVLVMSQDNRIQHGLNLIEHRLGSLKETRS